MLSNSAFPGNHNQPQDLNFTDVSLLEPSNPKSQQYVQDKCQTDKLDKEARQCYTNFVIEVLLLLERLKVDVNVLILAGSCLLDNSDDLPHDVCGANSIASLLQAIQKNQTWFNYGIFEALATKFGKDEGKKLVESYERQLNRNVEQRVKTQEVPKEASRLVVKLNWKKYDTQDIVDFRNMLAKLLKRDTCMFVLKSVEEGCIELVYIIPSDLCESVRHLKATDLEEYGVIAVTING